MPVSSTFVSVPPNAKGHTNTIKQMSRTRLTGHLLSFVNRCNSIPETKGNPQTAGAPTQNSASSPPNKKAPPKRGFSSIHKNQAIAGIVCITGVAAGTGTAVGCAWLPRVKRCTK